MKTNYHQKLKPVIRYLEQHYNTQLNLEDVARLALLSPYHFHRVFKAVTGETLNEYLRRLRLQQADATRQQQTHWKRSGKVRRLWRRASH